jgi:hypothetical protein
VAFVADTSGLDQAWVVSLADGKTTQLTHFADRAGLVAWSPSGEHLLVTVDAGGNEHDQLYLVPAAGGEPRALTAEPGVIHRFGAWSPDGRRICYSSNRRHPAYFDVWVMDVATGEPRCVLERDATLMPRAWSPDGEAVIVSRENTNLDTDLLLVPLDGTAPCLLTAHIGEATYLSPCFAPDGRTLYVLTNRDREFLAPAAMDLPPQPPSLQGKEEPDSPPRDAVLRGMAGREAPGEHAPMRLLAETVWDAEGGLAHSHDGRLLAWASNEAGISRLVFYDLVAGQELPARPLPPGVVEGLTWAPDSSCVAFGFNGTMVHVTLPFGTSRIRCLRRRGGVDGATSVTEWCELYLLRKPVGGREITVALDKDTTDHEHRIVRRSNLCHSLRHGSFPTRPANEVIASCASRGACADVGKISAVRRISELHAVVPARHVRHVQHERAFGEVEPAADVEHVVGPGC